MDFTTQMQSNTKKPVKGILARGRDLPRKCDQCDEVMPKGEILKPSQDTRIGTIDGVIGLRHVRCYPNG
jgi:hypothetical protein